MESSRLSYSYKYKNGKRSHDKITIFTIQLFEKILRFIGLARFFYKNAKTINTKKVIYHFEDLPKSFNGYKILHLTDLHIDERPDIVEPLEKILEEEEYDLIVFTGDYVSYFGPHTHDFKTFTEPFNQLLKSSKIKIPSIGILGNHDSTKIASYVDQSKVNLLINNQTTITKGAQSIQIIGTDDVFHFYTKEALEALKVNRDNFTIALVHSPDLDEYAETCNVNLYLCGHTHAGQIALPNGWAPFTQTENRRNYRGKWEINRLQGYTSAGVGTCVAPLRMNTQGEVVIHELRCS